MCVLWPPSCRRASGQLIDAIEYERINTLLTRALNRSHKTRRQVRANYEFCVQRLCSRNTCQVLAPALTSTLPLPLSAGSAVATATRAESVTHKQIFSCLRAAWAASCFLLGAQRAACSVQSTSLLPKSFVWSSN